MSKRGYFHRGDTRLSYVDFGGSAPGKQSRLLIALHGRSGSARNFAPLAKALAPDWHVMALDQRGHGWSDHPDDGSRDAFIDDAARLIDLMSPRAPVALLGHSLGGVNAFQLAARRPELVQCVIVEDIPAHLKTPPMPLEPWPLRWESLAEMLAFMRASPFGLSPLLLDSIVEHEDGWGFRFTDAWYDRIRPTLQGDHSADWASVRCPILLLRGTKSWALNASEARRMAALNPKTELVEFDAGHVVHDDQPAAFHTAVAAFLKRHTT